MILVDTNIFVALVEERDALHRRAVSDLKKLVGRVLYVTTPVLTETCFALPRQHQRARLRALLDRFCVQSAVVTDAATEREDVFNWLDHYAEHDPDWADGHLAVLSGHDKRLRVWTYDREFSTIWRRPDGSAIALATTLPTRSRIGR